MVMKQLPYSDHYAKCTVIKSVVFGVEEGSWSLFVCLRVLLKTQKHSSRDTLTFQSWQIGLLLDETFLFLHIYLHLVTQNANLHN